MGVQSVVLGYSLLGSAALLFVVGAVQAWTRFKAWADGLVQDRVSLKEELAQAEKVRKRLEMQLGEIKQEREELRTENDELIAEMDALQKASVPRSLPPDVASSRHISNRHFRIIELVDTDNVIRNRVIDDCTLFGPAVLMQTGHGPCYFQEDVVVGDEDTFFWTLAPNQEAVQGAIGIENCTFRKCRFSDMGMAGPMELVEQWKAAFRESTGGSDSAIAT